MNKDQTHPRFGSKAAIFMAVVLAGLMLLSGCNFGSSQSAQDGGAGGSQPGSQKAFLPMVSGSQPQAAGEDPQNPAAPGEDWEPVYRAARLLSASCDQVFDTFLQFQIEAIDLGKAQNELVIEAEYVRAAQQVLSDMAAPGGAAQPYKAQLEASLGTISSLLAQREAADLSSLESTDLLLETCSNLVDSQDEIASAAVAGMSEADLQRLELETTASIVDLQAKIQAGR